MAADTTKDTTTSLDPSQSTLSSNFDTYVYNMLSKGETAAKLPYESYKDQRFAFSQIDPITGRYTAGYSPLEKQAFSGLDALDEYKSTQFTSGYTPSVLSKETQFSNQFTTPGAYNSTQFTSGYTPLALSKETQFGNRFTAPGEYNPTQFTSGYTPLALSRETQFSNQFTTPGAYNPTQFNTGLGSVGSVQSYMSPYMSAVTDIEAREARRQADIGRQAEQARLAQAGAFGGSRQAIMEAERQRNLGTQIGDITSRGLQGAYDRALAQRAQEAGLGLEAQRGAEASRQFGAGQAMTAAQLGAQYGLSGLQAQEAARQFQEQQRAREAEFGATQGLEAQRGTEASRQFGATYGLRSLADQLAAGKEQRAIAQQPLDFGYQQFQESLKYPYQQATYMQSLLQGLPLEANKYVPEQSKLAAGLEGALGLLALMGGLKE